MSVTVQPVDRETWRRLASGFRDYNYRHIWEFGAACAARVGARSEHVAIWEGDELFGLADVRVRHVPFISASIAYINGGPLVRRDDGHDSTRLRIVLHALQAEFVSRRHLVLRIAPAIGVTEWISEQQSAFAALGAVSAEQTPYRTLLLPIDCSMEELRRGLSKKWRNNLKRAEAEKLEVRDGEDHDACATFAWLHAGFRKRKGFGVDLDAAFYARVQDDVHHEERFHVTLAYVDGEPIAGHLCSMLGDTAVVILRASTPAALKNRASYLLQWHAARAAQASGCRYFDLGGIDPEGNPGVYEFKKGMGGVDLTAPGPFEFAPAGPSRMFVRSAEGIYRWMRRHIPRRAKPQETPPES